jgi:asparagine synthase (glutamine-hydrolysing)
MLDAMQHRGPDGRGTLAFDGGAAGMVRLALVDLSDRGQQPLWSADRRVAILFNGEIYNFRAERDRLATGHGEKGTVPFFADHPSDGDREKGDTPQRAGKGDNPRRFQFATTTDTEVILNLYLERGLEFVDRLRGMYALAVFDWRDSSPGGRPVMVLARGPLGIKPLYVAAPAGDSLAVIFASEVRALLASGLVGRRIDREALAQYLGCGFVIQPRTIIEGVRMLEPGTLERYAPGKPVERRRFWQLPPYEPRTETLEEAAERLRGVLEESVELHAFADAPVGAFLSGGVDSSGVVGMMRRHIHDLRTYTLKFPDVPGADEADFVVATAKALGCVNTVVELSASDIASLLPEYARAIDQPSNDGLNTWLISRAAAEDVKAVLSGLGGDEWFAGYPVTRRMANYATHPLGRLNSLAGKLAAVVEPHLPEGRVRQRAHNLAMRRTPLAAWLHSHSVFRYDQSRRMVGLPFDPAGNVEWFEGYLATLSESWRSESPVGLSCLLDAGVYMGSQLLRDSDVMSMASSLELRTPLVDAEVVRFSRTCRDEFKLRGDGGSDGRYAESGAKRVLIEAMRGALPADIDKRPKRGFALPAAHWMRTDLSSLVAEACHPETIARRGLIDPAVAGPLVERPESAQADAYPRLWTLLVLELWCRAVLDVPVMAAA